MTGYRRTENGKVAHLSFVMGLLYSVTDLVRRSSVCLSTKYAYELARGGKRLRIGKRDKGRGIQARCPEVERTAVGGFLVPFEIILLV